MAPICDALIYLLIINEKSLEEKERLEAKLESLSKVLSELMDMLEKKTIVR
jgi:hypothetical protein